MTAASTPRRATVHVRELLADTLTPLAVYRRLSSSSPIRFLFESVTGGEQVSRYSLLGAEPLEVYRLYQDRLEVERGGHSRETLPGEPLDALRAVLRSVESEPGPIPFTGGFVGYFGFDLVRLIERLPSTNPDPANNVVSRGNERMKSIRSEAAPFTAGSFERRASASSNPMGMPSSTTAANMKSVSARPPH